MNGLGGIAAAVAVCAVAGTGAWLFARQSGDETSPPTIEGPAEQQPEAADPQSVMKTADFAIKDPESLTEAEKLRTIRLPNGTRVPTLNGITLSNHNVPGSMSKAPIVGVRTAADGRDYYLHEDGAITTTIEIVDNLTGEVHGTIVCQRTKQGDPEKMHVGGGQAKPIPKDRR